MTHRATDWRKIRQDYELGNGTVTELCKIHGITKSKLYYRAKRDHWARRSATDLAGAFGKPNPVTVSIDSSVNIAGNIARHRMLARLQDVLERQMAEVEARLATYQTEPASDSSSERDARTLSSLVRTFERLLELQDAQSKLSHSNENDEIAEEEPQDIDAFREELTRRLDDLRRTRGN